MASIDEHDLQAALSPVDGTLKVAAFDASVTVVRDEWGIPHIRAQGVDDAYRALGFVHAQDRLFQMELNLRRAVGRAAEWLGPSAIDSDVLVRRLGMEEACRRDLAALGGDARVMLESYAHGVNAWIETASCPPVEYKLLETAPERWQPWHSIAVMRRLGLLMGSVWFKLWRAAALPVVGADGIAKLRYDDGGRDMLCIPPGQDADRHAATLAELQPAITALLAAMDGDETGGGSNNWAVGPGASATGRPVLAGDPHRAFEIPNMYAQHHLACDAFDVIGLTVPGVPGFPHFAHNGRVAYCVTHAFMDIHDVFLERFEDAATQVLTKAGPVPVGHRTGTINVRGAAPHAFEAFETPHGPVIAGDPRSGHALALRSVQFAETDLSFDCLPRMAAAGSVESLYEATRGWGIIDHNLVAGDIHGSIGHQVRALVPRRPRENGWLPMPGWTGEYDWQGWIPHEDMPCVINPPGDRIVTANNRVVSDDYADYLCTDCHPPYRARRIMERLRQAPFRPEDAAALHADTLSPHAGLFKDRLAAMPVPRDAKAAALREALLLWDGRMDAASTGAAGYAALRRALTSILAERSGLSAVAAHPFAAVPPGIAVQGQLWWALPTQLRNDDASMLDGWDWTRALQAALSEASRTGSERWGALHQPRLTHPLSTVFPQAARLLDPPSLPVGGDSDTVLATGIVPAAGPAATYGALSRYVFDVGKWDESQWVVFHGVSGQPGSPHYADQNPAWSGCTMVPMRYDWMVIEKAAAAVQHLEP
ncbi:MAG: penicillin amidase [Acetobacteraceae bacterium]|nr:penicillin amidase [Acetobacteraceae bacterium]